MIPKIIHYCWFGGKEIPEKARKCIKSWEKYCPDYKIIKWSEENYEIENIPFLNRAAEDRKWSFVTDYVRLDIIYKYGGIYLDTDVELIKSPDELLNFSAFFGFETNEVINTGLGYGAEAGYEPLKKIMEIYKGMPEFNSEKQYSENTCPVIQTPVLEALGFKLNGETQINNNTAIFSKEYFCPLDYKTGDLNITDKTRSIHWYDASWMDTADRKVMEMRQKLSPIFGLKNAWRIAVLVQYPKYKGIKATAIYYLKKLRIYKDTE